MKNTAANKFTIKYKKQYQMLQSRRKKKPNQTNDRYQALNTNILPTFLIFYRKIGIP